MPNFFTQIFRSSPPPVQGKKTLRPKTVQDVLGESFNYAGSISASKAFCKKILKFCASEYSVENVQFVLLCEKYKKAPSAYLFNIIYDDFVSEASDKQVNLPSKMRLELGTAKALTSTVISPSSQTTASPATAFRLGAAAPSPEIFDKAVIEVIKLIERDSIFRLKKAQFDTAFTLNSQQERFYDLAAVYLKSNGISLM